MTILLPQSQVECAPANPFIAVDGADTSESPGQKTAGHIGADKQTLDGEYRGESAFFSRNMRIGSNEVALIF